ncbi:glycosyltransferase family 2 protein [Aridibaculum aurantiacum]|uniref:glycosyltransferase family 2 protein n=1 Tax=Aridibaculum aurantiacum TaxID=2810307 RepID=UPI001A965330|nr:glycosyltransferase family 2 protein [Aridibaculum aurantiacum]
MKISGFTIIKNAVVNDYPVVEAIRSILPVVDEMIVLVGDSKDTTVQLVEAIADPKIKIHHSVWDPNVREGGAVLAIETNKAFQLIDPASDWAFYIQADEVVHEQYHAAIVEGCKRYKDDHRVQGLLFKYLHFYGTYNYVGDSRKWYNHEVRIIRNDKKISAYKDAQGFRVGTTKLKVKPVDAYIYHYGWVKSPAQMMLKLRETGRLWNPGAPEVAGTLQPNDIFNFNEYDSITRFNGTHPAVMQQRVNNQNWQLQLDPQQKKFSFKNRLLYLVEKLTGLRLFQFKNYKIIR